MLVLLDEDEDAGEVISVYPGSLSLSGPLILLTHRAEV